MGWVTKRRVSFCALRKPAKTRYNSPVILPDLLPTVPQPRLYVPGGGLGTLPARPAQFQTVNAPVDGRFT